MKKGADMDLPKVSAVCSTYGRWWLLEEMVASFLAQDYGGPLELVVVNDAPCRLSLAPGVQLPHNRAVEFVNLPDAAPSNPWKRDLGVSMATGEWCTYYDDDDVLLPHRFRRQVAALEESGADWLATHVAAVWVQRAYVEIAENFFFCSHLWRRAMLASGPVRNDEWDDVSAADRLRRAGAVQKAVRGTDCRPEDVVHVYRWGGGEAHHSGVPGGAPAISKERDFKLACRRHPRWRTGPVALTPRLHARYPELWASYMVSEWDGFKAEAMRRDREAALRQLKDEKGER